MRFLSLGLIAAASLTLSIGTAKAALFTQTYSVTGTNFISTSIPPYQSITETFTVLFDTTKFAPQQTTGISLSSSSTITPTSALGFAYSPLSDTLTVGGIDASVGTSSATSIDFSLTIQHASQTVPNPLALSYSDGNGNVFSTTPAYITLLAVPEPTSLALFGSAVAAFGFIRRRRK